MFHRVSVRDLATISFGRKPNTTNSGLSKAIALSTYTNEPGWMGSETGGDLGKVNSTSSPPGSSTFVAEAAHRQLVRYRAADAKVDRFTRAQDLVRISVQTR